MKPFNIKQLMEMDFNIPNLHSDFRFEEAQRSNWDGQPYAVMKLQVNSNRVIDQGTSEGLALPRDEWLDVAIISKRTGRVVDHWMHLAKWSGLITRDVWAAQQAFIDGLYYLSNPPKLRLLNGKLRKGIYKEVARRLRSPRVHVSTYTMTLLNTVIDETKRLYPELTNKEVISFLQNNFGILKLRHCILTDEILPDDMTRIGRFGAEHKHYKYDLNPANFGYHQEAHDHNTLWIHESEIFYRGHCYKKDQLVMRRCPECDHDMPEEGFEDGVCFNCVQNRYKIHSYSTRVPTLLKFKAKRVKPSTIYLGIELEYETTDRDVAKVKVGKQLAGHAIMKSDGSINNGFEIVTCPATLDIHLEEFKKFYDKLPGELFAKDNTGMHVHVSRKPLSKFTIGKMTEFLNRHDNKAFIKYIAGRIDNRFAKIEDRKVTFELYYGSGDRYNALNLGNSETIEFRIFSTPTNWEQFASRLEFCQALVDYCQPCQVSTSLKELTGYQSFINWLRGNRKAYPELSNHLKGFA